MNGMELPATYSASPERTSPETAALVPVSHGPATFRPPPEQRPEDLSPVASFTHAHAKATGRDRVCG